MAISVEPGPMTFANDLDQLRKHVPAGAFPVLVHWLRRNRVWVRVVPPRATKLGDFRSASGSLPPRISVNNDLNRYAFLVTLVHEFAHHTTHEKYRRTKQPHGPRWQAEYSRLMRPYMSRAIFPADVLRALEHHLAAPPSSSCSDHQLMRALRRYDRVQRPFLEDLPPKSVFRMAHRIFVKGPQLRKRYRCKCLNDRRIYLIDPLAEVHVETPVPLRRAS
jgi:hypothetical protein